MAHGMVEMRHGINFSFLRCRTTTKSVSANLACFGHMQIQSAPVLLYQFDTADWCQRTSPSEAAANLVFGIFTSLCVLMGPAALDPLNYFGFYKVCHVCLFNVSSI